MAKFRKGDIVTVEFVVEGLPCSEDPSLRLRQLDHYQDIFVSQREVTLTRAHFRAGDLISWPAYGDDGDERAFEGTVLASAADHLWVDRGGGNFATVWAGKATRLDEEPSEATAFTQANVE